MGTPLVSCVMITGKDSRRRPYALAAVDSFRLQTHGNLELVVINDSQEPLLPHIPIKDDRIREFMVEPQLLGGLRNIGLDKARGRFVCQWDDDDFSHPDRVAMQLAACDSSIVTLGYQVRFSFESRSAFVHRAGVQKGGQSMGIAGTVLHPNTSFRYPVERKHEDSHFLQQWKRFRILSNVHMPHLYLRFYTGLNTWNAWHVMQNFQLPRAWQIPKASAVFLRRVLLRHYGVNIPEPIARRRDNAGTVSNLYRMGQSVPRTRPGSGPQHP